MLPNESWVVAISIVKAMDQSLAARPTGVRTSPSNSTSLGRKAAIAGPSSKVDILKTLRLALYPCAIEKHSTCLGRRELSPGMALRRPLFDDGFELGILPCNRVRMGLRTYFSSYRPAVLNSAAPLPLMTHHNSRCGGAGGDDA